MIEVHTWPTPNGHKIHIMVEETGLEYEVRPVNIRTGEQFKPEFLRISPNNKIPAIVDRNGPDGKPIAVFESGAILIYLAGKTGKLLPRDDREKYIAAIKKDYRLSRRTEQVTGLIAAAAGPRSASMPDVPGGTRTGNAQELANGVKSALDAQSAVAAVREH